MSEETNTDKRKKNRWFKWPLRLLLFIVLVPILFSVLLQIPPVQKWAVNKATSFLSDRMKAEVSLDNIDLSIFKGLELNDITFKEIGKDTVLSANSINVSLSRNLFSLLNNSLSIQSIRIDAPVLNLVLSNETGELNLIRMLNSLLGNAKQGNGQKLNLNIKELYITNLDFSLFNERSNSVMTAKLEEGKILLRKMDLNKGIYDINTINLIRPQFTLLEFGNAKKGETVKKELGKTDPICLTVSKFDLLEGSINIDKRKYSEQAESFVFNNDHLAYEKIKLDIKNLSFGGVDDLSMNLNHLSLQNQAGFQLKKLQVPDLRINNEEIALENFFLETGESKLSKSIHLKYEGMEALKHFVEKVNIDASFENSTISLKELTYFLPAFTKSEFYKKNNGDIININGRLSGRVNNLKGNGVQIDMGNKLAFNGDFSIRNVNKPGETLLNLRVQKLNTNVEIIKEIVPGFNPPPAFYKLGNIDFVGNFDGYLNDFVAFGKLKTDLGVAELDLRLDVKKGNEFANYSGDLSLKEFDLQQWSGNKDLGKISFKAKIKDGHSLVFKNANADLEGTVDLLQFRNYDYKGITINGKISPKEFLGKLISKDPNIDMDFNGSIIFASEVPKFNFKSVVNSLRLDKLNLGKDFKYIKGDLTFTGEGSNVNNLIGALTGSNIIIQKGDSTYQFKQIVLKSSSIDQKGGKQLEFVSDQADIKVSGNYNLNNLVNDLKSMIKSNFPYHTRNWDYIPQSMSSDQLFHFDIDLRETQKLFELAGIDKVNLKNFKGKGYIDSKNKEINLASSLPLLVINDLKFFNLKLLMNNKASKGDLLIHIDSSFSKEQKFNTVDMQYLMKGDNVEFSIDAKNLMDSIQNVNVKGLVVPHPKGYTISLVNNDIRLYGKRWKINNESLISIGDKFLDLENLMITDGTRNIEIQDINNRGLNVKLNKIDLASLNPIINYDKILFGGEVNSAIRINDIFNSSPSITGSVNIPQLTLNGDGYGELTIDLAKAENRPLEVLLSLNNEADGQAIKINGRYDLENKNVSATVKGRKVSLKFLEYILKAGISNVKGYVDVDADVTGKIPDIQIDGKGSAHNGEVKINYLGETYRFNNQDFIITDKRIDLTGAVLSDSQGNEGTITGGLNHTLFKDFYLDAYIVANNVIAIKTSKFDNPIYYGLGIGEVTVDFSGSVHTPRMVINAITKPGTKINIPIKESRSTADKSFITFIDKKTYYNSEKIDQKESEEAKVEGISIEMNLTMTEDAIVNLIFDEFKNDIITGIGKGNLRIAMSNKGEFDMFGTYTITRGEYLFTAFNFVNKPFVVREGGTIRWTGDPINANLNIEADYSVRTTLTSFLTEYLVTDQLKNAAGVSTPVNLKLLLGNTLYNPTVKFDFEFPALTGELKSYTDSKMRLLRNNEADYNSQVFGLIVFNSFIPSNTISDVFNNNTNFIQSAGINTLSEFVGSQLSIFVTGIVNEALEKNGLISGIDFDIDLRNTSSFGGVSGSSTSLLPTEIEVRLKNKFRFLDERLSVNVGGNYVRQNTLPSLNNYIVPEFFIEYALTKDRQLNLKLYGKYDLDEISLDSRRQKFGLGLRYKNEFGSMVETKTKLSQGIKQLIKKK